MANFIRLGSIFNSVANSDFPYMPENVLFTITTGNRKRTLIHAGNVKSSEFDIFAKFLTAIDVDINTLDNFGSASFMDDAFTGHSPCYFGNRMVDDKPTLGLLIGISNETLACQDLFIPCLVEEVTTKQGKKDVTRWIYTINGTELRLKEKVNQEGKGEGKFYVELEYSDDDDEYTFSFPFLIDKKLELSSQDIQKSWRTGKFSDICRDIDARGGNKCWLQSNKAFTELFQSKTFPEGGVYLLVRNGKIKITPALSHPNITSDIVQSDWEIITTSHPDLIVTNIFQKERISTTLKEGTNMQFTSAMNNNEGYKFLHDRNLSEGEVYTDIALLHFAAPSALNVTHTPINYATGISFRIEQKLAYKFPEMFAIYKSLTGGQFAIAAAASANDEIPDLRYATPVDDYEANIRELVNKSQAQAKSDITADFPMYDGKDAAGLDKISPEYKPNFDDMPY